jgi:hypothetical protein
MADPIVAGAKAEVAKVESSVKADVAADESKVVAFAKKYWPVAAALVVGLVAGHLV